MNYKKFVDSLSDVEKDEFIDILLQNLKDRKEEYNVLYEKNCIIIDKWSNYNCNLTTKRLISEHFTKKKILFSNSYLNMLEYEDLISIRNMGPKKINEFLSLRRQYKKSNV